MRKCSLNFLIFMVCFLLLSVGCGKLKRKGPEPTNAPPTVHFSDTPPEGYKFSTNPRIYWWGTDVDGFITAYQYAVVLKDSLQTAEQIQEMQSFLHGIKADSASWVDQNDLRHIIAAHLEAEYGGNSANVGMYADMNPNVFTPQYLFLRAVDNSGGISDVIYQLYYRNNHRPQAFIDMDSATLANFVAAGHYCLEETTTTWKGISIPWTALDTADYKDLRNQPAFGFKWELVGPFPSPPTALTVDTTAVADSSLDSVFVSDQWVYSRWVSDRMHVFKGLENFSDSGYGWYQLRVRARDDALVSTDTATTVNFRILKPRFRYADRSKKTILIVDATMYGGVDGGADVGDTKVAAVRSFYQQVFSQPGLCDEIRLWYDPVAAPSLPKNPPGVDVLSRYDLAVVVNVGSNSGLTEDNCKALREYLNIGGRVWFIGLNNFNLPKGRAIHYFTEIRSASPYAMELGTTYLGLDQVFVPTWTPRDTMTLEFIGAEPFGLWTGLPSLQLDTLSCQALKGYEKRYTDPDPLLRLGFRFGDHGIPYVCFDGISNTVDFASRIPYQRRIYSFVSYYGSISPMDDRPCGVDYIGPTFRTAEFTFPLNLLKNDAPDYPVNQVVKGLVDWFWENLP
ncbi:MAG: hypothetical protein WCE90_12260 [Candidatus Zixiibacteriota bacterium]